MNRKGIILAGGKGERLYPLTKVISKQLLPIFDKPAIYYPLSTLMMAGVNEILLITDSVSIPLFKRLLSNGSQWGIHIDYAIQEKPEGIAQAILIAESFLNESNSILILGDNLFFGNNLNSLFNKASSRASGATIFAHQVKDPQRYGVPKIDKCGAIISIEEKPKIPPSNYAITGIYFFDKNVINYAKTISKSSRGEFEISDVNNIYINSKKMNLEKLGRGNTWFDVGTFQTLLEASEFVSSIENRQGLKISCPEEIAFRLKKIDRNKLLELINKMPNNQYRNYLLSISRE